MVNNLSDDIKLFGTGFSGLDETIGEYNNLTKRGSLITADLD